jgi:hypothetical protein
MLIKFNNIFSVNLDTQNSKQYFVCLKAFHEVHQKHYAIIQHIAQLIELVEVLKAFSSNKLDANKLYYFKNFTARVSRKDKQYSVQISFSNWPYSFYFDKLEANIFASQLQKIVSISSFYDDE